MHVLNFCSIAVLSCIAMTGATPVGDGAVKAITSDQLYVAY
jgi:hypothetical protein